MEKVTPLIKTLGKSEGFVQRMFIRLVPTNLRQFISHTLFWLCSTKITFLFPIRDWIKLHLSIENNIFFSIWVIKDQLAIVKVRLIRLVSQKNENNIKKHITDPGRAHARISCVNSCWVREGGRGDMGGVFFSLEKRKKKKSLAKT